MLYPLSYEGLRCTFAQRAGRVLVHRTRAGCLAPDGLCRICAACHGPASHHRPNLRRRVYGGWYRAQSWRPRKRGGNDVVAGGCGGARRVEGTADLNRFGGGCGRRSCPRPPGEPLCPIRAQEAPHRSSTDDARPGQRIPTAHAAVSVPKPCVAGSNPAGGTTTHQTKPSLTSTNLSQGRSCVLPRSVVIRPRLPPFAKPSRNGERAWGLLWIDSSGLASPLPRSSSRTRILGQIAHRGRLTGVVPGPSRVGAGSCGGALRVVVPFCRRTTGDLARWGLCGIPSSWCSPTARLPPGGSPRRDRQWPRVVGSRVVGC
jgi:hypothetical protein